MKVLLGVKCRIKHVRSQIWVWWDGSGLKLFHFTKVDQARSGRGTFCPHCSGFSRQGLPRQSFLRHFGHSARSLQIRYLCTMRNGLAFRATWISQLRTLSRSVTPWTLRKKTISAICTWDSFLSVITQDSWLYVKIGTKTDLKTDNFAVFENSSFVTTER